MSQVQLKSGFASKVSAYSKNFLRAVLWKLSPLRQSQTRSSRLASPLFLRWHSVQPLHFHKSISCTAAFNETSAQSHIASCQNWVKTARCITVPCPSQRPSGFLPCPAALEPGPTLTSELETFHKVNQNQSTDPECTRRSCFCRRVQPQPLNPDMWGRKAWHLQLKAQLHDVLFITFIIMWSKVAGMSLQRSGSVMVGTQSYTLRLSSQKRLSLSRAGSFHGFALGLWNK